MSWPLRNVEFCFWFSAQKRHARHPRKARDLNHADRSTRPQMRRAKRDPVSCACASRLAMLSSTRNHRRSLSAACRLEEWRRLTACSRYDCRLEVASAGRSRGSRGGQTKDQVISDRLVSRNSASGRFAVTDLFFHFWPENRSRGGFGRSDANQGRAAVRPIKNQKQSFASRSPRISSAIA